MSVVYEKYRGVRESYYKGTFFVANEDVDHHLKAVNYQDGSVSAQLLHCVYLSSIHFAF